MKNRTKRVDKINFIVIINTMSYTVEQKIGNNIYVYEVESYWDPQKKQPRQRRRYIGKKDPVTGEVVTPRKGFTPRKTGDYGHVYLLEHLGRRIGLYDTLKETFSELFREIFYLSLYQLLEAKPLYLYPLWAEASYLKEGMIISSQRISRIVEKIGRSDDLRQKFFALWRKRMGSVQAVIFDITSLSSYSCLIEYLEWGYNRDKDHLPQINFGLIIAYPSKLPLSYRIYPGSIKDVTTLKNIVAHLDELEVKDVMFILDRGFYSASNIEDMDLQGIRFIIPLPFSTKLSSQLISQSQSELSSPLNGFYYRNRLMFHIERDTSISKVNLKAHIYHDEKRKVDEVDTLFKRICEIEKDVALKKFRCREDVKDFIEGCLRGGSRLFEITGRAPSFNLKRRVKAISRLINKMGRMILITNKIDLEKEEILSFYRKKDKLEKMFDVMKNEITSGRLRVRSQYSVEGRIFITFVSLILYSELHRIMKEKELYSKYTIPEVFFELKKLRVVKMTNGKEYLTEVSKKQRTLFEKFEVPVPVGT